ncbi:MAG: PepSY domain-containing protein [Alphaproteobacteria bacterium]|nr:PepSY domain-containing protein [Alphaproteobacteria bacterium]MBU1512800.1 PepSY domain-containing protein [Alphaproteobacteria bacterium]MBU2093976.1 PepSY domain-containing protein [Alphaproteobacteria bacterium]MBU2149996.1 PepSY domain-containing protein [Alphaproteobacteria bacterium]MBU2306463.1 PepSY domain-containing protein [Alphaproteobacteria bacterium]
MKRLFALAVLLATATTPVVAVAQDYGRMVLIEGGGQDHARRQAPLSRVLAMLASRYPGRHLNSTMGDAGGRPAYYVQWQMENGRVVVFVVDAESGQVIGRQGG